MSQAYKCDRCGAFFERDKHDEENIKYRLFGEKDLYYITNYRPVHLCHKCSKALHEWMEKAPTAKFSDLYVTIHTPAFKIKTYIPDKKKRWWKRGSN